LDFSLTDDQDLLRTTARSLLARVIRARRRDDIAPSPVQEL